MNVAQHITTTDLDAQADLIKESKLDPSDDLGHIGYQRDQRYANKDLQAAGAAEAAATLCTAESGTREQECEK